MYTESVKSAEALATATRAATVKAPPDIGRRDKASAAESANEGGFQPFGADGLTFADVLDVINPLQHIPLVSSIYRQLTGDEIDPASRVAGGTLFGGLIGAAVSVFNVVLKEFTGRDSGEHMLALLSDEEEAAGVAAAEETGNEALIAWNGDRVLPQPQPASEVAAAQMAESSPALAKASGRRSGLAESGPGADVFAAVRYGRDGGAALTAPEKAAALGAAPSGNGWFSSSMLTALARYEHGAELALPPRQPQVDFLN